ncbi:hypothetical protein Y602_5586 [Burkholderia pseudomallei MSHR733]|nr:hypothetical protein Y602_5586 [Burkholderia pseudomallei MSHR733]KGW39371.1 hypothetical protein Y597_5402 [Burkholderia pseudomallei MSHR1000]
MRRTGVRARFADRADVASERCPRVALVFLRHPNRPDSLDVAAVSFGMLADCMAPANVGAQRRFAGDALGRAGRPPRTRDSMAMPRASVSRRITRCSAIARACTAAARRAAYSAPR